MKVIDLLNKMANDKDYRPTVSFLGVTFTYNTIVGDYENDRDSNYGIFTNYVIENILNDEVGVIKEKKGIEELPILPEYTYAAKEVAENRLKINEIIKKLKESEEK